MAKGDKPSREATILDAPTIANAGPGGPEITTLAPMPSFDEEPAANIGAIVPSAGEFDLDWPTDADLGKAIAMPTDDASEGREVTAKIPAAVISAARKAAGVPEPRSLSATTTLESALETSAGTGATDPNIMAPPAALFQKPEPSPQAMLSDLPFHAKKPPPMVTEQLPRPRRAVVEKHSPPRSTSDDETLDRAPTPPLGLKVHVPLGAVTITRSRIDPQLLPQKHDPSPAAGGVKEPASLFLPKVEAPIAARPPIAPIGPVASIAQLNLAPVVQGAPPRQDGRFRMRLGKRQRGEPLVTPMEGGVTALVILVVGLLISLSPAPEPKTLPSIGQARWVSPPQAKAPPRPPPLPAPAPPPPMSVPVNLTDEQREAKLRALEADYWKEFPRPPTTKRPM